MCSECCKSPFLATPLLTNQKLIHKGGFGQKYIFSLLNCHQSALESKVKLIFCPIIYVQLLPHNFFENKSCLELEDGVRSSGKSECTACEEIVEIWYQLIMDDQLMLKNYRLPLVIIASQSIALHWLSLIINIYWSMNKVFYIICDSLVCAHQNVPPISLSWRSSPKQIGIMLFCIFSVIDHRWH